MFIIFVYIIEVNIVTEAASWWSRRPRISIKEVTMRKFTNLRFEKNGNITMRHSSGKLITIEIGAGGFFGDFSNVYANGKFICQLGRKATVEKALYYIDIFAK